MTARGKRRTRAKGTRAKSTKKKKSDGHPSTSKPGAKPEARRVVRRGGSVRVTTRIPGVDPGKVADRYGDILDRSCSVRERRLIERGGVDIIVARMRGDALGEYAGRGADGRHRLVLSPEGASDPETMAHETVHILQSSDRLRPLGDRRAVRRGDPVEIEARTEAEAVARTSRSGRNPGYYKYLGHRDPMAAKTSDRRILRTKGTVCRRTYAADVSARFGRTEISRLKSVPSKKIRKRSGTSVDTSTISAGLVQGSKDARRAMAKADRDGHIYTETVDRELRNARREPARRILRKYADDHAGDLVRVRPPTEAELKETGVKGNDRRVLYEAGQAGAEYMVTSDKIFRVRGDEYRKVKVRYPNEYLKEND